MSGLPLPACYHLPKTNPQGASSSNTPREPAFVDNHQSVVTAVSPRQNDVQRPDPDHHHPSLKEKGARELINQLFNGQRDGDPIPSIYHPLAEEMGIPLPRMNGPRDARGVRLAYLSRDQRIPVPLPAPKNCHIAVVTKPMGGFPAHLTYGTVLGFSEDDAELIWQERSSLYASYLVLSSVGSVHKASACRCNHCGRAIVHVEMREHMQTHMKGSGVKYGLLADDPEYGYACGDTGLLQSIVRVKELAKGAQGTAFLYRVVSPRGDGFNDLHSPSRFFCPNQSLTEVVVKQIKFDNEKEAVRQYQKSVRLLTVMQDPHLVEYLAVQIRPDRRTLRIVMPYYDEGSVATEIMNLPASSKFEESFVCSIALQLSSALCFLHDHNPPIAHGDIKVENVMFYNHRQQIVLMDLDASCEVFDYQGAVKTDIGTFDSMAPETVHYHRLMPASDMWSLGVFLYVLTVMPEYVLVKDLSTNKSVALNAEMWATQDDLRAIQASNLTSVLRPNRRIDSPAESRRGKESLSDCVRFYVQRRGYSNDLTQLIVELLTYNPWKRPSAKEVQSRLTDIMTKSLLDGLQ